MTRLGSTRAACAGAFAAALLLPQPPAVAAVTDQDQAKLVERVIDKHLLPAFVALKAATAAVAPAVAEVCVSGSDEARSKLRGRFGEAADAVAAVDFYRFGPLAAHGRRERLAFWPDPRGFVARQMRMVLTAKDPALLRPGALAAQSAAVQGLPALEWLMTDQDHPLGPGDSAAYACGLAGAIAANIATVADENLAEWSNGERSKLTETGPQNDTYKSHAEAAAEFIKAILTGLQVVADMQLKPRLENAKVIIKGPYSRLGLESEIYTASLESLRKLYAVLDLESYLAPDKVWMKSWVVGAWRAAAMSDGVGGPAKGTAASDAPPLREVVTRLSGVRMLIGREMSNAAGIAIGFNGVDGD